MERMFAPYASTQTLQIQINYLRTEKAYTDCLLLLIFRVQALPFVCQSPPHPLPSSSFDFSAVSLFLHSSSPLPVAPSSVLDVVCFAASLALYLKDLLYGGNTVNMFWN